MTRTMYRDRFAPPADPPELLLWVAIAAMAGAVFCTGHAPWALTPAVLAWAGACVRVPWPR